MVGKLVGTGVEPLRASDPESLLAVTGGSKVLPPDGETETSMYIKNRYSKSPILLKHDFTSKKNKFIGHSKVKLTCVPPSEAENIDQRDNTSICLSFKKAGMGDR